MTGGIYRNGQEVAVRPNATGLSNTASWSINEAAGIISFVADIKGTSLLSGDELAFHWGMTCQNDVIEGSAPVPEPATMMLLGTGLLGLAGAGRKKLFKK